METKKFNVVDRGCGGYCGLYGIDSLEVSDVVVAVRYSYIGNESRKYYEIPVSEKNQNAVIAAFPELDLKEDEPGYIDLYGCDDETAVKVGTFAAELDGDLTPEPETPNNNDNTDNTMKANNITENRVKCYGDNEMNTKANELRETGFARVENAYWVEHWQKGDNLIILERCDESERPTPTETEKEETEQTETTVISLPKYYTETPERLRFLARSMADQYRGLNDPEAKRMMALYLDITGNPEYFLKNNLIKAI